ncbi:hypothetical protein [Sessilibacter corallicola]|uniref:Uncharacterized protein n=1 Tax=Sessilibacter corallicola TaxID=2904075 RepID=A0ABQ0A7D3_9GAMM
MSKNLAWIKSDPKVPGIYLAAIKLGEAAGVFDFLVWSGEQWETDEGGEIIAHVDVNTLKRQFDIPWPETTEIKYKNKLDEVNDSDLWEED